LFELNVLENNLIKEVLHDSLVGVACAVWHYFRSRDCEKSRKSADRITRYLAIASSK